MTCCTPRLCGCPIKINDTSVKAPIVVGSELPVEPPVTVEPPVEPELPPVYDEPDFCNLNSEVYDVELCSVWHNSRTWGGGL